jgi:phage shock protein A
MTTPDPKAQVQTWRKEIAVELAAAREEIAKLTAAHEEASTDARAAADQHRELEQSLASAFSERPAGFAKETLAAPLAIRLRDHGQEVKAAQSRRDRAAIDLKTARRQVDELEHALRQIDALLAPAADEKAA